MSRLTNKQKVGCITVVVIAVIGLLTWYLSRHGVAVLDPAGEIGQKERHLMLIAILLSAIVVLPVYSMTIMIAYKYRASNKKAKYDPDWDHSRLLETIWWGIPCAIILVLSIITWNSSHALDPYRPIASKTPAMNVQVVALDWKWLFIYPESNVASVNLLEIPNNTPINFDITSDTVMNSFWIPRLGGQIYAMPGMQTQLHLEADKLGSFAGSSANISGTGFADMAFTARSVNEADFQSWVSQATRVARPLNMSSYTALAKPTYGSPVEYYSSVDQALFDQIIDKYMMPSSSSSSTPLQGNQPSSMPMEMN